jgi:uncharacterized protein involved in type VI secretion and phage assembly
MADAQLALTLNEIEGSLVVHSFSGHERLSSVWRFDLVVSGPMDRDMERVAIGRRATIRLTRHGRTRVLHGVVARVSVDDLEENHRARFRVRVVPRLAMLRLTKHSRIFQDSSVPEILSSILGKAGIAVRLALARMHPKRAYCTQYEETDYDFVKRLAAEAGLYFYFYAGPGEGARERATVAAPSLGSLLAELVSGDSVVFADDPAFYPWVARDDPARLSAATAAAMMLESDMASAPSIASAAFRSASEAFRVEFVAHDLAGSFYDKARSFRVTNRTRPTGAMFRDYDPDKPLIVGSYYNGTHPPPFPLPSDKTRSGFRTQSSPGGDGFNELSFEDRKGTEEIFVRAQRNLREEIGNDRLTEIGANEIQRVGNNRMGDIAAGLGGERFLVHNWFAADFVHELFADDPPVPG